MQDDFAGTSCSHRVLAQVQTVRAKMPSQFAKFHWTDQLGNAFSFITDTISEEGSPRSSLPLALPPPHSEGGESPASTHPFRNRRGPDSRRLEKIRDEDAIAAQEKTQ